MNAIEELRKKNTEELHTELLALLKERLSLKLQRGSESAPKTHLHTQVRKQIARVKTLLNQKEQNK